jgi:hypothetical protein
MSNFAGAEPESAQVGLVPEVRIEGLDYPVYLTDATQVTFEVDQSSDPVIAVDRNGLIKGLRPGTANVPGTFGGTLQRIEVNVYSVEKAPAGLRRRKANDRD